MNQVKELSKIPVEKTAYLLWLVLKALGEVINKNRCWQGYKEKSFRAEYNL